MLKPWRLGSVNWPIPRYKEDQIVAVRWSLDLPLSWYLKQALQMATRRIEQSSSVQGRKSEKTAPLELCGIESMMKFRLGTSHSHQTKENMSRLITDRSFSVFLLLASSAISALLRSMESQLLSLLYPLLSTCGFGDAWQHLWWIFL